MPQQRTVRVPVHFKGIGVHTGRSARVTLRPAPPDSGIRFVRNDVGSGRLIGAHVDQVSDTLLATTLGPAGESISTVEHLLSALWGEGVDNAVVEVEGDEIPILDGSALPFVTSLRTAGVADQEAPRRFVRVRERVEVRAGDAFAALAPFEGFKATYTFVADHPVYNRYPKRAEVDFSQVDYLTSVGRARSFGLIAELPQAHALGRCLGSSLENAVGIGADEILNPEGLRCADEFVNHKILDAIGDLYLLGARVVGAFEGYKSGHALNCALARALIARPQSFEVVTPVDKVRTTKASRRMTAGLRVG
jgi:UDP-3-O-[3-hydroxymyristoyl] N-acetylglucosamine deacetylase